MDMFGNNISRESEFPSVLIKYNLKTLTKLKWNTQIFFIAVAEEIHCIIFSCSISITTVYEVI